MREMKDSGIEWIGEIPQTWKLNRIKYAFNIINGYPFQSSKYSDDGIRVIRISDVEDDYLSDKDKRFYPESFRMQIGDALLRSDDILVTLTGYLGKCYLVTCKDSNLGLNQRVGALRLKGCLYDVSYMKRIIQCEPFRKEMELSSNGSAQLNMSNEWLKNNSIPCPSLNEQHLIASFLDTKCAEIDALSADIQSELETLEAYKRSVITEAVTNGLDKNAPMKDSGIDGVGLIPLSWTVKRVKYIAKSISKGNGITKEQVYDDGDIQCVRYGEIYSKYSRCFLSTHSLTRVKEISSPKYIKRGDILFAGTGELIEEIGKNIVYMGNEPCLAGGDIIVMCHDHNPIFMNYALGCAYSQKQKSENKAKLKVVHISAFDIGNIRIAFPCKAEQAVIADFLDSKCAEIDTIIAQKQEQLVVLADYKKSIIYEYVTGKKEVPVA